MAIINVEIEDKYFPKDINEPVSVFAEFGNGQPGGGYVVFLNQELKGFNGVVEIGSPKDLCDKWTIISATIVDKLGETNWTSISVSISQGNHKTNYGPYSKLVPKNLDTVCYLIKILNICGT